MVSAGRFPVPEAVKPDMPGVALAVHAKVEPATFEARFSAVSVWLLQMVCVAGKFTFGNGSTIMVKLSGGPLQPLEVGIIVNITESMVVPPLVIIWAGILPVPLALKPVRLALVAVQA